MSIGKTVNFQYDNIISTLTITGRTDDIQYVYIDIPDYVRHYKIYVGQIRNGQLGGVLKKITADFKYEIDDIVSGILITDRYRVSTWKYYSYICLKDGYRSTIREDHLTNGHGCPVCTNRVVLRGYNDIATTNPKMAELFCNEEDASRYMEHAHHFAYFRCPRCANAIHMRISDVARRGLSCKKCGDGISYPNKFVYNFVEQLSMRHKLHGKQFEFTPEKKFPWSMNVEHENKKLSGKKIYDMFIDTHNIIIENHGDYHYVSGFVGCGSARSLEEVQENDRMKRRIAIDNGIKEENYIVLDCHQSEMSYIKKSIMSSNLPLIFGFTEDDIDWKKCDEFATSSRVYEACNHWNCGIHNLRQIARMMKMDRSTISRYIRKGRELNIIT
jgi:DNA-directed RNA polymerase subunit RPC12/RpoP